MCLPGDRRAVRRLRAATAALVVEEKAMATFSFGERQHLRQQVVVMRSGSAVQHEQRLPAGWPVATPVQRHLGAPRDAILRRGRNGRRMLSGSHSQKLLARSERRPGEAIWTA